MIPQLIGALAARMAIPMTLLSKEGTHVPLENFPLAPIQLSTSPAPQLD
jgi:hypothetical protein